MSSQVLPKHAGVEMDTCPFDPRFPNQNQTRSSSFFTMPTKAAKSPEEIMQTAPFDPRFPNVNQSKYCYQSYVDWHRCTRLRGEDYSPCEYFKKCYKSLCPNSWIEQWDTQVAENRFPGKIL